MLLLPQKNPKLSPNLVVYPTKHTALLHTQVGFTAKSRLAEENERISDQLATYVERPRTEGQEANGNANANSQNGHNGDHFKNNEKKHQEEEQVWHKKYLAMSQEHEQILKEKDVIMQNFSSVESQYKTQVSKLEADLEDQRAKNNVSFFL